MSDHSHKFNSPEDAYNFIMGGRARVTLVSLKTGARFSYRIAKSEDGRVHFVSVLNGDNNETDYAYMGVIRNGEYSRTAKSRIGEDAPSAKAWSFFWGHLQQNSVIHPQVEIWHEGRCCVCGRVLTVPESIESGIGPECADRYSRAA